MYFYLLGSAGGATWLSVYLFKFAQGSSAVEACETTLVPAFVECCDVAFSEDIATSAAFGSE